MLIDCESCAMRETAACGDCVVTYLLDEAPVELTEATRTALANLADHGLVPGLKLVPRERNVS
ncbi:MAG: hypothetical protein KY394_08180 [Actinobacteria bacterium]|nr:hypothetical protein [Actinomycetota bacterium]